MLRFPRLTWPRLDRGGLRGARFVALGSVPVGLAFGAIVWMLMGGTSAASGRVAAVQGRLAEIDLSAPRRPSADAVFADAAGRPLFVLTSGPGAVPEVALRLDGLSRSARRVAALLSINGGPAEWLSRGGSRDGVTLLEIVGSKAVVSTALGRREVELGAGAPTSGPSSSEVPAGFRTPPAPASAPVAP